MTSIEATLCHKEAEDNAGDNGPLSLSVFFLLFLFLLEYPVGTFAEEKDIPVILSDLYLILQ